MTCKNCGAQLADNAVFCSSCGMPVAPAAPVAPLQPETAPVTENTVPVQPEAAPVTENAVPTESADAVQLGVYEAPYQNTQPVNNGAPYMNGQPVNGQAMNNSAPYMNGQPVNGQAMNNSAPYMNGQPVNGQPMNNGMPYQNGYNPYGYQNTAPAKKKKTGLVIGIIVVLIAVIVAALFFILGNGNRSYKAAARQYVESVVDHDLSGMIKVQVPRYSKQQFISMSGYSSEKEFWDDFDESMESEYGSHVKLSYEIKGAERMEQDVLEAIEDALSDSYDYEADITDGYEVEVLMHVKGDDGTDDVTSYLTVVEIKGKWYICMI